ncbi:MAG: YidC/Oxa1 family rane protein insertase, partial [Blastocatellia bacterium]|nr:YidC/Oxa1 family rane protein insertase [Blastocatellia bacterium]
MQQQQRFIVALVASAAVLILWNVLFPPVKPPQPNANANNLAVTQSSPQPTSQSTATTTPTPAKTAQSQAPSPGPTPDNVPQRKLRVTTPLYEVTFDTRGAVATSWIVKKVRRSDGTWRELYSAGSTKNNPKPLELILTPPAGVAAEQLFRPFQIVTGDATADGVLAGRNFKVTGANSESSDATIDVPSGSRQIEFTVHDEATGLDANKRMTFFADRYIAEIEIRLTRNNQPVPHAQLAIGPNIGDQGIDHYTFYSFAPEGVAVLDRQVRRINALEVHSDRKSSGTINWILEGIGIKSVVNKPPDHEAFDGTVQWAGVDDTYFGMMAVPSKPTSGLEYRTTPYEFKANGKTEQRFLITGLVPVPTDGSKTEIYTGPKDHRLLAAASEEIKQIGGPQVDLGEAINFGFLGSMRRFLAVPILFAIDRLQRMTGSYGVAIMLFTIFIYSLFFPLKWQSSRKMKKAQKYAPRMKELQEKLKSMKSTDPRMKELQMEQLRLMKEANPLGGCLPLLIQMPFLFALYSAITISIDFRQASFLWIPDLSGPEPYIIGFIRILPLLFASSMIILQLMTPAPSADPMQRKMMAVGMPLMMLYILWSAPAGLLIYWLVGNIVGFLQQFIINRMTKTEDEGPPPDATGSKKKPPPKKLKPAEA